MKPTSIRHLKNIPLFASVPEDELELINRKLTSETFDQENVIINQGDDGDCLYIINEGRVKVIAETEGEEIVLSYLAGGDYFGEMALITGEPRSATVIAATGCNLWRLSKTDFDTLILNNPGITLSLTHMLSHRLQEANKAREASERFYKHQITPRGTLAETDLVKLLKYAEENSLSGTISLKNKEQEALFTYEKGRLERLSFADKEEGEAMDELLEWQEGEFTIKPRPFKVAVNETISSVPPRDFVEHSLKIRLYEKYLREKIEDFIKFAGSGLTQLALNKSFNRFKDFFEVSAQFKITAEPQVDVKLTLSDGWEDRHTLFMAVLLRDLVVTIDREVVGMNFWDHKCSDEKVNRQLTDLNFFEYYEQAREFVRE